jgi:hypothetical protein
MIARFLGGDSFLNPESRSIVSISIFTDFAAKKGLNFNGFY